MSLAYHPRSRVRECKADATAIVTFFAVLGLLLIAAPVVSFLLEAALRLVR